MAAGTLVIASDKYKGAASSPEVCSYLARGFKKIAADWEIIELPQADGGEGTVDAVVNALGGEYRTDSVRGPRGNPVEARWGLIRRDNQPDAAVIEMAAASGLALLKPEEQDPFQTSTYGTGQLLKKASQAGAQEILLGIGGSATVDGGLGAALALGYQLKDSRGQTVQPAGASLKNVTTIDDSQVEQTIKQLQIEIACDVTNPLLGDQGAAKIYGPQKGASPEQVPQLEENMENWANLVEDFAGKKLRNRPGAGAAGGLGFGLMGLLGAELTGGAELVAGLTGLNSATKKADLLITGEGKMDGQTAFGKTPQVVAEIAQANNVKIIIGLAGAQGEGYRELYESFDLLIGLPRRPMSLEESIKETEKNLVDWGEDLARLLT